MRVSDIIELLYGYSDYPIFIQFFDDSGNHRNVINIEADEKNILRAVEGFKGMIVKGIVASDRGHFQLTVVDKEDKDD